MEKRSVHFTDFLNIIRENLIYLLIAFVVFTSISLFMALTAEKVYRLEGSVMLNMSGGSELAGGFNPWYWSPNLINNQIYLIRSYTLMNMVSQRMDEKMSENILSRAPEEILNKSDQDTFVSNFILSRLSIKPIEDSDIIILSMDINDPELGKSLLTLLLNTYREYDLKIQKEESSMIKDFLSFETIHYEELLQASEDKLKEVKATMKSPYLGNEAKKILDKYSDFQSDYYKNRITLAENEKHLEFLTNRINELKAILGKAIPTSNKKINFLISKISSLESELIVLRSSGYKDDNPKMKELQQRVDNLNGQLKNEIGSFLGSSLGDKTLAIYQEDVIKILNLRKEITILKEKELAYKDILERYEKELTILPEKQLDLTRLIRESELNEKMYNMLKEKLEEAKIQTEGVISKVQIVDYPVIPSGAVQPKRKQMVILGALFGLFFGLFFIFLKTYLFKRVDPIEIKHELKIGTIAEIPYFHKSDELDSIFLGKEPANPHSHVLEYLHLLKISVENIKSGDNSICLLTSPDPSVGKSTVSVMLALAMAPDKKILLVDCDLRKPSLHKILNIENTSGIFDFYKDSSSPLKTFVRKTAHENVFILTAGTSNEIAPVRLLSSGVLNRELQKLKKDYDVIIIDTPPLKAAPDSLALSKVADNILLVFHNKKSTHYNAIEAINKFSEMGSKPGGIIINFRSNKGKMGYYYYSDYGA
ncbi:AAA family ATPase [bacterium]|nr:AAA family ATPase [bacterium]